MTVPWVSFLSGSEESVFMRPITSIRNSGIRVWKSDWQTILKDRNAQSDSFNKIFNLHQIVFPRLALPRNAHQVAATTVPHAFRYKTLNLERGTLKN